MTRLLSELGRPREPDPEFADALLDRIVEQAERDRGRWARPFRRPQRIPALVAAGAAVVIVVALIQFIANQLRELRPPIVDQPVEREIEGASADRPPPRIDATLTWLPDTGQAVLIGGYASSRNAQWTEPTRDDLWVYDPETERWSPGQPLGVPIGGHGAAYHPTVGRVVVFGGSTGRGAGALNGETWLYDPDGGTWTTAEPVTSPPQMAYSEMVYDPRTDQILLLGGERPFARDARTPVRPWTYDVAHGTWSPRSPADHPIQTGFAVSYDPDAGVFVVYGGHVLGGPPAQETGHPVWTYDPVDDRWQRLEPAPGPPLLRNAVAVYDPVGQRHLHIGGTIADPSRAGDRPNPDVWAYELASNTWEVVGAAPFDGLTYHAAVLDPDRNAVIVHGGLTTTSPEEVVGGTWLLDLSDGTWRRPGD